VYAGESFNFDLPLFCNTFKFEQSSAFAALRLLEQDGWISLSDDAFTPARVHLIANRETLYDYQIRNRTADLVFKVLLRAYPGIQLQPVEISESLVAKYANLPVEVVRQTLDASRQENMLVYFAQQNSPQLVFLQARVPSELLQIDMKRFNFRKKQAEMRVEAAIEYAEKRQCRSVQLLGYFGEKDGKSCGICDVCTGRNKPDLSEEAYLVYEKKIREILRLEPLPLEEILKGFAQKRHELVAQTLQYLLDEGKMRQTEDGKMQFLKSTTS
jgi:ATP-dependent DNA helicase RecQ